MDLMAQIRTPAIRSAQSERFQPASLQSQTCRAGCAEVLTRPFPRALSRQRPSRQRCSRQRASCPFELLPPRVRRLTGRLRLTRSRPLRSALPVSFACARCPRACTLRAARSKAYRPVHTRRTALRGRWTADGASQHGLAGHLIRCWRCSDSRAVVHGDTQPRLQVHVDVHRVPRRAVHYVAIRPESGPNASHQPVVHSGAGGEQGQRVPYHSPAIQWD